MTPTSRRRRPPWRVACGSFGAAGSPAQLISPDGETINIPPALFERLAAVWAPTVGSAWLMSSPIDRSGSATGRLSPTPSDTARALTSRTELATRKLKAMSVVEQPDPPHLRSFTVDDDRLADARPLLSSEEFALTDVTDDEWDAFHAAIADA